MYVSTLRNYIEVMGGELKMTAEFPEGAVQIEQFENVVEATVSRTDGSLWDVRCLVAALPGPQKRGTGGTLGVVGRFMGDRGHQPEVTTIPFGRCAIEST